MLGIFGVNAFRAFTTSSLMGIRNMSHQGKQHQDIVEFGKFVAEKDHYERGQLFIHKVFAYRGIITKSSDTEVPIQTSYDNYSGSSQSNNSWYYHVLIHNDDWNTMNFDYNLTTFLHSSGNGEQKNKAEYNGMDVVSHDEILPYESYTVQKKKTIMQNVPPIKNEHYAQFFNLITDEKDEGELFQQGMHYSAMLPHNVFKQLTDSVEVQVLPFYLGANMRNSHTYHCWRCLFRIINMRKNAITLRDRKLETTSMIKKQHVVDEEGKLNNLRKLTPSKSATQFNSHFELPSQKGNKLWGYFIAEDDQGQQLKLTIPLITLEDSEIPLLNGQIGIAN